MSNGGQNRVEVSGESWISRLIRGDKVLWITAAVLAVISVLVVYSSTAKMAYGSSSLRPSFLYLRDQLFIICLSLAALLFCYRINSRLYNRFAKPVYLLFLGLTLLVYFIGASTNGAARWINILGFNLQPSEGLKVATILFMARQLASRQNGIEKLAIIPSLNPVRWWKEPRQQAIWREGTIPILGPVLVSSVVIFPAHTSSSFLVFATSLVMMLIGRVKIGELVKLVSIVAVALLVVTQLNLGRSQTAGGRVETWIKTWVEPRADVPLEELSDTERSMIAIYNGGVTGLGAGRSAMRVEVTHPESDYAFALFVEEYGLIMAALLLMLYLWIFFRAIVIFQNCGTAFPGLLVLGLALMITSQALLHIMVTTNLMPETGQTLPLISRGGSSMLFTSIALGMILSVSRQNEEQSHDRPKAESMLESVSRTKKS